LKPGSDLAAMTHTVNRHTGDLTKYDAVVLWDDIRDEVKNETQKCLYQIKTSWRGTVKLKFW